MQGRMHSEELGAVYLENKGEWGEGRSWVRLRSVGGIRPGGSREAVLPLCFH